MNTSSTKHLRKSAGWLSLWALGVGAVISADFFGWQFGLLSGGFLGLAIATLIMGIMYTCIVFSIAELSTAFPSAGGLYVFTRHALGPFAGFICGISTMIEYILIPAMIGLGIGNYMHWLVPDMPIYIWWLATYFIFVSINLYSSKLTFEFCIGITLIALCVLIFFYINAIPHFEFHKLFNIPATFHHNKWLPMGFVGILAAIPSAIWFFLAIEELPMAAEETIDVNHNLPRALILALITLLTLAFLTLFLNTGLGNGAKGIAHSAAPLSDGLIAVFYHSNIIHFLIFLTLAGLIASFHSVTFAYGRVIFALGRDNYLPKFFAKTNKKDIPYVAILSGAMLGFSCLIIMNIFKHNLLGRTLLNMTIFGAIIAYLLVMISYIKLKVTRKTINRPYKSPLGITGAVTGLLLASLALIAIFITPALRSGLLGIIVLLCFGGFYYFLTKKNIGSNRFDSS